MWGWVDDDLAELAPWRFDVASVRAPVAIWYGLEDVFVPAAHGAWLARNVPGAVARVESSGHMGDPDQRVVELNAWLLDGRPWD
ncbi:MAG: hypothetical protein WB805_08475 [Candidatus Dormiibacterota bacterium]